MQGIPFNKVHLNFVACKLESFENGLVMVLFVGQVISRHTYHCQRGHTTIVPGAVCLIGISGHVIYLHELESK